MNRYRQLNPKAIVNTLEKLHRRIDERFPGSGLATVSEELTQLAHGAWAKVEKIAAPNQWLRLGTVAIMIAGITILFYVISTLRISDAADNVSNLLQGLDALVNLVIVMGAGILFLTTLEGRWKRHEALADLNELRNIVHVIDMHQLTKDPSAIAPASVRTKHSPVRNLRPFELMRYLDYSSELLSLTAKVAALYGQSLHDPHVQTTIGDLSQLTANMTSHIWQKINIIRAEESWKALTAERARNRLDQADPAKWASHMPSRGKDGG